MITGFEGVFKIWPAIATLGIGLVCFGEIRADIHNLSIQQTVEFQQTQQQITNLQNEITSINEHFRN